MPTGAGQRIVTGAPVVKLQVEDVRKKKVFFRTILGENDDEGKSGILRLITPPKEVFKEGFTQALQAAGYQLREDTDLVYEVRINRFLAIDRENAIDLLDSDIMLEVLIKRSERVLARKTIFVRDTKKTTFGQVWQDTVPPLLNRSLSRAIEKAIQDKDLIGALGTDMTIVAKTPDKVNNALPGKQYSLPQKPPVDSLKRVELSETKEQDTFKTASIIKESRSHDRRHETDFVIKVIKGLPHRFPEGDVKGLWLSSVPLKLDVFAFPKGYHGKFKVFNDWVTNRTDTPYYLGKTPLLAKLKKGMYEVLFVHPPIEDKSYIPQYRTRRVGPLGITAQDPICPFIAQRNSVLYAVRGVQYWTEERQMEVRSQDTFKTAIVLFQREDQTPSDMLPRLPIEKNFNFGLPNALLRDPNYIPSPLSDEELAQCKEMLERGGIWAKEFRRGDYLRIDMKPNNTAGFERRRLIFENESALLHEESPALPKISAPKIPQPPEIPPIPEIAPIPKVPLRTELERGLHRTQIPFEADKASQIEVYRQAAEQGDANSQYDLAMMYYRGQGVAQDYKQAFKWFAKAAEQGLAEAQNNLGLMYSEGKGVTRDYQKTFEWYTKAAAQGLPDAQNNLGTVYRTGKGVARDYKQAVNWYRQAAEQGHAEAQNNLGSMYNNGLGVARDYRQAFEWYKKAAEQGNALAQSNLGQMYDTGHGVSQDHKQAFEWFRKSAQQGNFLGQYNLALLYYNARGVSKNYVEAYKWATIAANSDKSAAPFKTHLKQYMSSSQIAEAERKAREFTPVLDIPFPLHKAAEQNNIALVKSLIEKGANVNAADQLGWSPLHYAAYRGHKQTAELLLNSGAIVNAKADNGVRPLHLAAEQGQTALVKLLLGKGADVNVRQVQGWTSLGLAAQKGHLETVKLLLEKGADVNSKSKSGLTPLHTAVSKGSREVVELLLSKGAEVNAKSNNGRTPLHTAAYQNQQEVVKLLLAGGADPRAKDIEGKTPIDFATDFGNVTMAKLLAKTTTSPQIKRQQKIAEGLPIDGVYSKDIGSGGSYKDPVHGFFEVKPPQGFKIVEQRDRTTTRLDNGTVVPYSRIRFQSDKARIAVVTRKAFKGTIEEDSKIVVNNLRSAGAGIATERFVIIDGSKGIEVDAIAAGYRLLLVKYKKHGLDHAMTMSCSPADFLNYQNVFTDFLSSYRSLKPK
jgi:TPR repeat protein